MSNNSFHHKPFVDIQLPQRTFDKANVYVRVLILVSTISFWKSHPAAGWPFPTWQQVTRLLFTKNLRTNDARCKSFLLWLCYVLLTLCLLCELPMAAKTRATSYIGTLTGPFSCKCVNYEQLRVQATACRAA